MKLYILRGVPGCGKSTKAKEIVAHHGIIKENSTICSTDDFFIVDGKYQFNPKLLGVNHQKCFDLARDAMKRGRNAVILDNTNIKRHDFQRYIDAAKEFGYQVEEMVVGGFSDEEVEVYFKRNSHGVPLEKIQQMARAFQE